MGLAILRTILGAEPFALRFFLLCEEQVFEIPKSFGTSASVNPLFAFDAIRDSTIDLSGDSSVHIRENSVKYLVFLKGEGSTGGIRVRRHIRAAGLPGPSYQRQG